MEVLFIVLFIIFIMFATSLLSTKVRDFITMILILLFLFGIFFGGMTIIIVFIKYVWLNF